MRTLHTAAAVLLTAAACEKPDLQPAEDVVGAAAPIAFAASYAMLAMAGEAVPCATITLDCVTDPCPGEVAVELGPDCPLPLGEAATGTVFVDGTWTGRDDAILAARFDEVEVDGRGLRLNSIEAFIVTRDDDEIGIAYALQDVAFAREAVVEAVTDEESGADEEVAVDQSAWKIDVALSGTPADPADDVYSLDGASQVTGEDAVKQVAVTRTVIDPSCRKNPIEGDVTINDTGGEASGATILQFHADCDGEVDIRVSAGLAAASSGSSQAVDFFD